MKRLLAVLIILVLVMDCFSVDAQDDGIQRSVITPENVPQMTPLAVLGCGEINDMAWSSDGTVLAVGTSAGVWILDGSTLAMLHFLEGHRDEVATVAWSSDGTRLVSASIDGVVLIWNIESASIIRTLVGLPNWHIKAAWSLDDTQILIANANTEIQVWNVATGENFVFAINTIVPNFGSIDDIAWSPDRTRLAFGMFSGLVRIWDVVEEKEVQVLEGHDFSAQPVTWSSDGKRLATLGNDQLGGLNDTDTIRIWNITTGENLLTIDVNGAWGFAWSPDESTLAVGRGDTLYTWDANSGVQLKALFSTKPNTIRDILWAPDGERLVTTTEGNSLNLWSTIDGSPIAALEGFGSGVADLAWSPDSSQIVSVGGVFDQHVRVWNVESGHQSHIFETYYLAYSVAWSPDGTRLAALDYWNTAYGPDNGDLFIWDTETWTSRETYYDVATRGVVWSPDSKRLIVNMYDRTQVLDAASGSEIYVIKTPINVDSIIAWSPDGSQLAEVDFGHVRIWDTARWRITAVLHEYRVGSRVVWSSDGSRASLVPITRVVRNIEVDKIKVAAWSPDNRLLVTATSYGKVHLWDTNSGAELRVLATYGGRILEIAWSSDGTLLAIGNADGTIRIWGIAE